LLLSFLPFFCGTGCLLQVLLSLWVLEMSNLNAKRIKEDFSNVYREKLKGIEENQPGDRKK
jgi:hypothetical protein